MMREKARADSVVKHFPVILSTHTVTILDLAGTNNVMRDSQNILSQIPCHHGVVNYNVAQKKLDYAVQHLTHHSVVTKDVVRLSVKLIQTAATSMAHGMSFV